METTVREPETTTLYLLDNEVLLGRENTSPENADSGGAISLHDTHIENVSSVLKPIIDSRDRRILKNLC